MLSSGDPDDLLGLAASGPAHLFHGNSAMARDLLVELVPSMSRRTAWYWQPRQITSLVRAALDLDDVELAESFVHEFHPVNRYAEQAAIASHAALQASGSREGRAGSDHEIAMPGTASGHRG